MGAELTITYPRTLPSARVIDVVFELEPQESFSPEQGGRFTSTELGPPLWTLSIGTTPPSELEYSKWRAWLSSLRGAGRLFYGYDVRRPYPLMYPPATFAELTRAVSGGAFDGTSTSWSVNTDRDEITIGAASGQELPVGFQLVEGDYIGLKWDTSLRSVHRVLQQANANGSGVGTYVIEPPVNDDVPADATINLVKADCLMAVTKRDPPSAGNRERRISFEARQHLEF